MKNRILVLLLSAALFIVSTVMFLDSNDYSDQKDKNELIIAIDPGHGGPKASDKGYTTVDGIHECVMNNAVANFLSGLLTERGYTVIFTKEPQNNVSMPLQLRPQVANKIKADLLISIHHDASANSSKSGFWLFYSSYKVNLDNEDVYVQYQGIEYSLVKEKINKNKYGATYCVKTISDGIKTFDINNIDHSFRVVDKTPCKAAKQSEIAAEAIYEQMLGLTYIKPKGGFSQTVVDEEYRVLRYSDMPSVLIEAGYMSNPAEMLEIQKAENQLELAYAIADGIDAYFGR